MINLLDWNDRFVTVHNKCTIITAAQISAPCISCAKIACCSSVLVFRFLYAGRSMQNASGQFISCIHFSFVNFALRSTPQKECKASERRDGRWVRVGFQQLYLGNNSELDSNPYDFFFQNCRFYHLQKYWPAESLSPAFIEPEPEFYFLLNPVTYPDSECNEFSPHTRVLFLSD
jgi:hypothetical protein